MNRLVWFWVCALAGLGLLLAGFSVPAHLRAVDASVLDLAGRGTPGVVARGLDAVSKQELGPAELLWRVARRQGLDPQDKLGAAVRQLAREHPDWRAWGGAEPRLQALFGAGAAVDSSGAKVQDQNSASTPEESGWDPIIDVIVPAEPREKALGILRNSSDSEVQELLRCRLLTNTVIFAPSVSASGQALDAAIALSGLLLEEGRLNPSLRTSLFTQAAEANHHGATAPLEQALLDLTSLGQRFNWRQLAAFLQQVPNTAVLRALAEQIRSHEAFGPEIFAAVETSGQPAEVAKYLGDFSQTGVEDLSASLRYGAGGVSELARRDLRLDPAPFRQSLRESPEAGWLLSVSSECSLRWSQAALALKWLLILAGGFLLAAAAHFARPTASRLEAPLEVRGFHVAREFLFALGFLLVVLMLSEPFLAQESQKAEFPFRLRLPVAGGLVPAGNANVHTTIMNQLSPKTVLTLCLFFVLQALIYVACLVKLAEIKRQQVPSRTKLKLLENEEHLFDAGLYLGFAGTIVSLILVSLGVIQQSLMAAYSSTSFGIVFVSIFKIFHLRPSRRVLLLEAENAPAPATPAAQRTVGTAYATMS